MGTNYYVAKNRCECCNRYDEEYHIGKSSHGWAFTFQGYDSYHKDDPELKSWKQWKEYLKGSLIKDEYGEDVSYVEFVKMIETVKAPNYQNPFNGHMNLQHNAVAKADKYPWFNPEYDWDDEDGYAFSSREFS